MESESERKPPASFTISFTVVIPGSIGYLPGCFIWPSIVTISWGSSTLKTMRNFKQDKGQRLCINEFINAVDSSSESPISFDDIYEVQKWILYANKKIAIDS